jgi:hypothetical protein
MNTTITKFQHCKNILPNFEIAYFNWELRKWHINSSKNVINVTHKGRRVAANYDE